MRLRPNRRVRVKGKFGIDDSSDEDDAQLEQRLLSKGGQMNRDDDNFGSPIRDIGKGRKRAKRSLNGTKPSSASRPNLLDVTLARVRDMVCAGCCREMTSAVDGGDDEGGFDLSAAPPQWPRKPSRAANLFVDKTKEGRSLHQLFMSVVGRELTSTEHGNFLCGRCLAALNQIEANYRLYRCAVDNFRDTFVAGLESLEEDFWNGTAQGDASGRTGVTGMVTTEDPESLLEPETFRTLQNVGAVDQCIVKVVDGGIGSFITFSNSIVDDFHCKVLKIYRATFLQEDQETQLSEAGRDEQSDETGTGDDFQKAELLGKEAQPSLQKAMAKAIPFVYLLAEEWSGLQKKKVVGGDHDDHKVQLDIAEFDKVVDPHVLLGQLSTNRKILLSATLALEYRKQVPSAKHRYTCADCGSSFGQFHHLIVHLGIHHMAETEGCERHERPAFSDAAGNANGEQGSADSVGDTEVAVRTIENFNRGNKRQWRRLPVPPTMPETATLEKPFQCDQCGKCFRVYSNLTNHCDHYHGFKRECNVPGCRAKASSIQEFANHYAAHGTKEAAYVGSDPLAEGGAPILVELEGDDAATPKLDEESVTAKMSNSIAAKKQRIMRCPVCFVKITGIWRFFQHSFLHDEVPRFKCPVCPKRLVKVHTFKDHLAKHLSSQNGTPADVGKTDLKRCEVCSSELTASEMPRHMRRAHADLFRFSCDHCDATYMTEAKLALHRDKHVPRHLWTFQCSSCASTFSSKSRLGLHRASAHGEMNFDCEWCGKLLEDRAEMEEHLRVAHGDTAGPRFICTECKTKEFTLARAFKHFRHEHQSRPFTCSACREEFNTEHGFHRHIASKHVDLVGDVNDLTCPSCFQTFSKSISKLRHVRFEHLSVTYFLEVPVGVDDISQTDMILEVDTESGLVAKVFSVP